MSTILVKCKNKDCDRTFRIPEYKYNSTIKNNISKQECNICRNKKLLAKSTLYDKHNSKAKKVKAPVRKNTGIKTNGLKRAKKQNIDKALDNAWSKLVKLNASGRCEYCSRQKVLNSHHIFTRTNKAIRWRTINGICLCAFHHTLSSKFSAHGTPTIFTEWVLKYRGNKWHDELRMMANSPGKFHQFEKEIMLKELLKKIKSYESSEI